MPGRSYGPMGRARPPRRSSTRPPHPRCLLTEREGLRYLFERQPRERHLLDRLLARLHGESHPLRRPLHLMGRARPPWRSST